MPSLIHDTDKSSKNKSSKNKSSKNKSSKNKSSKNEISLIEQGKKHMMIQVVFRVAVAVFDT